MNRRSGIDKIFGVKFLYVFFAAVCSLSFIRLSFAADVPPDLKKSIDEKSQALQDVNQKLLDAQKSLDAVSGAGMQLQNEIKNTDNQINYLNLTIKGSEINIQKLGLEVESIGYDMDKINSQIADERAGMKQFLKEMQIKDNEETLVTFLKGASLSESLDEFKSIADLNQQLSVESQKLQKLNADLTDRLAQTSQKKSAIQRENENLRYRKVIVADEKQGKQQLLAQTKDQEKNYQTLVTDLEKQQLAIATEIDQLDAEMRKNIDLNALPASRSGVLGYPVVSPAITQPYGFTDFTKKYYTGSYAGKYHNGVDLAKYLGAEILAAEDGTVVSLGNQDKFCYRGAYGKFIVIRHNNGLTTLYGHLSGQAVEVGQEVKRGQLIGYMGKTGWATGPHLHFTVFASSTFAMKQSRSCGPMPTGGDLNPLKYL